MTSLQPSTPKLTGGSSTNGLGVSTASATGNPRNKVALKAGCSLMDWIKLTNSGRDLTGLGGRLRDVSAEELAGHCTRSDAWMAIRGCVYNVSSYFDFHPGGEEELERGLGIDATDLFDKVHPWVNFESMLKKCLVGRLRTPIKAPPAPASVAKGTRPPPPPTLAPPPPPPAPVQAPNVTWDWMQSPTHVTVVLYTRQKQLAAERVSIECDGGELRARVAPHFALGVRLEAAVDARPAVKVSPLTGKVEIACRKMRSGLQWSSLGSTIAVGGFLRAVLVAKVDAAADVRHLTFAVDSGAATPAPPLGWHVPLKLTLDDGTELVRNYSPVAADLLGTEEAPRHLHFLVKIYPQGRMTSRLDRLVVGSDRVAVGEAAGSFDVDRHVVGCRRLVLLAAGTGITPMIRIIRQALESQPETKVRLVFFNRRLEDVIWRDQWQRLVDRHSTDSSDPEAGRFRVWHVLSEAPPAPAAANGGSDDASGRCGRADGEADRWSGRIRRELLDATVLTAAEDGARPASICVCGPTAFTTEALRLLAEAGVDEESVHAFLA